MSPHELYCGLRSGKLPGYRAGGSRGRWIVETELVKARIETLMLANVKVEQEEQGRGIRRVL
jgi:hypothetical protein